MVISPINQLIVFDKAQIIWRLGNPLLFSLDIDGVKIYSKTIYFPEEINSGENTVGAFKNESKESLIAWLDPVTNKIHIPTTPNTYTPAMFVPCLILLLGTIFIDEIYLKDAFTSIYFPMLAVSIGGYIAFFWNSFANDDLEELLLNARLKLQKN